MPETTYPRDLVGYGRNPPHPRWPNQARICVQFVINYEEGGENNILHGDRASEAFLSEIVGAQAWLGQRHMSMESIYEYGSRAGFWRLWRMFTERNMPVTVYGVATALMRNPEAVAAMKEAGWEIASHGLKWIDYRDFSAEEERAHMKEAIRIHTEVTGERPLGWYTGRTSEHTNRLVAEEGGFLYSADSYADELPYWEQHGDRQQLIVPYTLDANDMRFATPQGFNAGDQFFAYLKDSFDTLYAEGETAPKMLSIGLHCRLVGRPGRAAALARFLDYVASHEQVWVARRIDIARHWVRHHRPADLKPSRMSRMVFVDVFGDIFEHSPWIAERTYEAGLTTGLDTAEGLQAAMVQVLSQGTHEQKLALINAHPDLAGRLKLADLTADSRNEQSSAGLDSLTEEERNRFLKLNDAYRQKFGFPFIMAVKGRSKDEILAAFEERLDHEQDIEFETAIGQIELIALLRLKDRLPSLADVFSNLA
ncbi:allantoinase PuuE [Microvirga lotononidis]|uniref:Chitooligosaccharide deacetylase n=1 Tax=Microvirga lotononidis TaxID=864069 RepID=I4YW57_9HYPH|nr:allantoinase PuuE [Microvirga lotononidis]EIM28199.1 OHCU decarboxylase [Microvirga lotononidis]WQO27702.1 allantoinase PuuE [Microvirga lotononidis]